MTSNREITDTSSLNLNPDNAVVTSSSPSSQRRRTPAYQEAPPEQPFQYKKSPKQLLKVRRLRIKPTAKGIPRIPQGIDYGKELRSDLTNMQFGTKQMCEMASAKERRDSWEYPHKAEVAKGVSHAVRAKREVKNAVGNDWVLFDILHGHPDYTEVLNVPRNPHPPPEMLRYEQFQPGAARIVEYNVASEALRLRSTPRVLADGGKKVEYTTAGPRLVESTEALTTTSGTKRRISQQETNGNIKSDPVEEVEEIVSEAGSTKVAVAGKR